MTSIKSSLLSLLSSHVFGVLMMMMMMSKVNEFIESKKLNQNKSYYKIKGINFSFDKSNSF